MASNSIKHGWFSYGVARVVTKIYTALVFKKKYRRNEIKNKKGPFVVIANHECSLDFANLVGATNQKMTFVISDSFKRTVPVRGLIEGMGVIAKKQFETTVADMRRMKQVIRDDGILVIYPAGLMCEDGLSTPIPEATFKFLKWLGADIYMARTVGSYFVKPKWSSKTRSGRTYIDIYKLFDKEELLSLNDDTVKERALEALLFDAYRDQDEERIKYRGCENIEGLENVLWGCPHCGAELSMAVRDKSEIFCEKCGYAERSDEYGMLHKTSEVGEEIRYVSDWSQLLYERMEKRVAAGEVSLSAKCKIRAIDDEAHKFLECGEGEVSVSDNHIRLVGKIKDEPIDITMSAAQFLSLPFKPGEYIELQHGEDAFRLYLENGKEAQIFVHATEVMHKIAMDLLQK